MTSMSIFTDPLELFRAAVAALGAEDWLGAARLCDPVSLRVFHRQTLDQLAPATPHHELTVEDLLRSVPEMPREVAEYQVVQRRRHLDPAARLAHEFPGISSADALRTLAPDELFARWLEGRSGRRQFERLAAHGRIPNDAVALLIANAGRVHRQIPIGVVGDGEHLAHVLYRHEIDESLMQPAVPAPERAELPAAEDEQEFARDVQRRAHPLVATCRRQPDGGWRLIADHNTFLNLGTTQLIALQTQAVARKMPSDAA